MALDRDLISELLAPFLGGGRLSEEQLVNVERYLELLLKWNLKMNLTAVRNPAEIVTRHFGESLFTARQLFPVPPARLNAIDLGSGAGFPGLPLKIWNDALELTLVESNQKKATFLREAVRMLGLAGVVVQAKRAETLPDRAELVTLRAVERFEQVLPVAARLLQPSGRLGFLIGASQVSAAKFALSSLNWDEPIPIPLSQSRVILVGRN